MKKQKIFQLSALTLGISTALSVHAASTPFAPLPLHLASTISTKANPNVLLLLDNSASMMSIPESNLYPSSEKARAWCLDVYGRAHGSNRVKIEQDKVGNSYPNPIDYCYSLQWSSRFNEYAWSRFQMANCDDRADFKERFATCKLPAEQRETRMDILKRVMEGVLSNPKNQHLRWGVGYLNYYDRSAITGRDVTTAKEINLGDNTAQEVLNSIREVRPWAGTPLTERYAELVDQSFFKNDAIKYRCQKNFVIILTDGEANGTTNTSAYQWYRQNWQGSNAIDGSSWNNNTRLTTSQWDETTSITNSLTGTVQTFTKRNSEYGLWALTNILASKDLKTAADGTDGDGKSWDDKDFNDGKQTISTSTIAFGSDVDGSTVTSYLQNGAQGENSGYYKASNAEELTAVFDKLVAQAITAGAGYSTTSPSISGSSNNMGTISLTLDLAKGVSTLQFVNLKRVDRDGNTIDVIANNDARGQLKGEIDSTRGIDYGEMTSNPSGSRIVLMSNNTTAPKYLTKDDINWTGVSDTSSPNKQALFDWLVRRSDRADASLTGTRVRSEETKDPKRMMGDVIGASVLQAGDLTTSNHANTARYTPYLATAANDGMVHIFKRNDTNAAQPYSLKLNWIPGAASRESLSSEPTVWDAVQNTTARDYLTGAADNRQHTYLINGGLVYRQTYNGHIFAVGALGQGGKGAYAFNIGGVDHADKTTKVGIDTEQSSWAKNVPLWETANPHFAGSQDSNTYAQSQLLGYTVSTPVIDRIAMKRDNQKPVFNDTSNPIRYIAALANGYFGVEARPALYFYDALGYGMTYDVNQNNRPTKARDINSLGGQAGRLIAKMQVPDNADNTGEVSVQTDNGLTSMKNGLSSPALIDMDNDGIIDVAYAGDLRGNMYRFDLRGNTPNDWKVYRIFKGSPDNPITAAPAIYRRSDSKTIVTFGTGRDLYNEDLKLKTDQYFYAIYDDLEKSWAVACGTGNECQTEVTASNRGSSLLEQEITEKTSTWRGTSQPIRYLPNFNSETMDMTDKQGWFMKLKVGSTSTGERVVTQPQVVDNAVFFITRIYTQTASSNSGAVCTKEDSSGNSWVMSANVLNGSNPSKKTTSFGTLSGEDGDTNFFSGYKLNGISSQPVFALKQSVSTKNNTAGKCNKETAHNDQGQSQDGVDCDLTEPYSDPTNFCSEVSSGDLIYNESSMGFGSVQLMNRSCEISLRRLSWREIF